MKKMFLGVLIFSVCSLYASEPIFAPGTEWHYRVTDIFDETVKASTVTMKDSLWNDTHYQFIGEALVREEGAKVWCVVESGDNYEEKLLYDFDLQVGDAIRTIQLHNYVDEATLQNATVTNVETITLSDGRSARRISYDNRPDDIEHIGSVKGIFGSTFSIIPPGGILRDFVCCTLGDNLLYEISEGECDKLNDLPHVTGLDNTSVLSSSATKILHDGQLFILRDGKTYTVTGMEIE